MWYSLTYSISRVDCQPWSWSAEQGKLIFPSLRSRLRIWSRETGTAVPSRGSLLILRAQAESGAFSRDPSRSTRQPPSAQSRVYQTTQLRVDVGAFAAESPPAQVHYSLIKVLLVFIILIVLIVLIVLILLIQLLVLLVFILLLVLIDQLKCASFFPRPLLLLIHTLYSYLVLLCRGVGYRKYTSEEVVEKREPEGKRTNPSP